MQQKRKRLEEDIEFEVNDHLRLDSQRPSMLQFTFLLDFILSNFIYIWLQIQTSILLATRPKYIHPLARGVSILYISKIITNIFFKCTLQYEIS